MPDQTPDTPAQAPTPTPELEPAPEPEPTAAITSRSAVVAAVLLLVAIVAAVILLQLGGGEAEPSDSEAGTAAALPQAGFVSEGAAAPDITLTSLEGEAIALSDYAGRPVLINFWASWCPPCREEFPVLAAARATYLEDGFEILGVTRNDQPEYSRKFVDDSAAEWPILPDSDDVAWEAYGPVGLPTSYFVDAEGVVQRVHIGPVSEEQLADHLAAVGLPASSPPPDEAA